MKKKSSIVKLSLIGFLLIVGLVFAFTPMKFGVTDYKSFAGTINKGFDISGGYSAVYNVAGSETEDMTLKIGNTAEKLDNFLVAKGYPQSNVIKEGAERIRVEIPVIPNTNISGLIETIGTPYVMTIKLDTTSSEVMNTKGVDYIKEANATYDSSSSSYAVIIKFTSEGKKRFNDRTSENKNDAITIDITSGGENVKTISSNVNLYSKSSLALTGFASAEEAVNYANRLIVGQFDVNLTLSGSVFEIPPLLSKNALKFMMIASGAAFILAMALMCFFYRWMGAAAVFAKLIYAVVFIFFLAVVPFMQFTLMGIAAVFLSFMISLDSTIIVFERVKKEFKYGKSILASFYAGYKKSLWTALDVHFVSLAAALILYITGTPALSSFALIFAIGTIISGLSVIVLEKFLLKQILNINSSDNRLYNLKRGKGFEDVKAEDSDVIETEGYMSADTKGGATDGIL